MKFTTKIGCLATVFAALHAPLSMTTPKPAPTPVPESLSFAGGVNSSLIGVQGTFSMTSMALLIISSIAGWVLKMT